jgi:hypothetical protein
MLLAIPGTFAVLAGILAFSAWAEHHLVSPQAIVTRVARHRKAGPDTAEMVVARQLEHLLRRRS